MMAFARLRIGADFGLRAPAGGGLGTAFRAQLEEQTGRPPLDDVHGAVVFPCEPTPRFFRPMAGSLTLTQSDDALRAELARLQPATGTQRRQADLDAPRQGVTTSPPSMASVR